MRFLEVAIPIIVFAGINDTSPIFLYSATKCLNNDTVCADFPLKNEAIVRCVGYSLAIL